MKFQRTVVGESQKPEDQKPEKAIEDKLLNEIEVQNSDLKST